MMKQSTLWLPALLLLAAAAAPVVLAMNKAELIDAMASDAGLSKADAKRALEGLTSAIGSGLGVASRKGVYLKGFGAFLKTSNEVCNGKDNDCNGRFDCSGELCSGVVCDGVESLALDGVCTGIDNDCDLEVLDDPIDDLVDFYADPEVSQEMGKFFFYYWTDIVFELANQLDLRADKSYSCAGSPDDKCKVCTCDESEIRTVSPGDDGGRVSIDNSRELYTKGNFMDTVVFWMREMRDVLDPDSDDDGLGDVVEANGGMRRMQDKKPVFHGHVTVLKARLQDPSDDGVLQKFSRKAGLGTELEAFVRDFFNQAIEALETSLDEDASPTATMEDDAELIVQVMAEEIQKGYPAVAEEKRNFFDDTTVTTKATGDYRGVNDPPSDKALKVALAALNGFVNATTDALKKGDKISLVGFGSFSISKRAARTGRNPQTGKEIKIAAKKVVKFKAGADLSSKVN